MATKTPNTPKPAKGGTPIPAKRTSAKTAAAKKAAPAKRGPKPVAKNKLDAIGVERIGKMILETSSLTAVAKKTGVGIATLLAWIEANPERSVRVREIRAIAARTEDELALSELQAARDPFTLAKAKETAHHRRWRASKIAPKEYGDRLAVEPGDGASMVVFKDLTGRKDA